MVTLPPPVWRGDMHVCQLPDRPEHWWGLVCPQCGTHWGYCHGGGKPSWVQMYRHEDGRSWLQPLASGVIIQTDPKKRRRQVVILCR